MGEGGVGEVETVEVDVDVLAADEDGVDGGGAAEAETANRRDSVGATARRSDVVCRRADMMNGRTVVK